MEESKNPWLSRKFWLSLLGVALPLLARYTGLQLDAEALVAIILPVVTYIVAEGAVDYARAKAPAASAPVRPGAPDLTQIER